MTEKQFVPVNITPFTEIPLETFIKFLEAFPVETIRVAILKETQKEDSDYFADLVEYASTCRDENSVFGKALIEAMGFKAVKVEM